MTGILVHGDNHFIVHGPAPSVSVAFALVRHWSLIQIEAAIPPGLDQWRIVTREFRENLAWAMVVPGDSDLSPAVKQLLDELRARGITISELTTQIKNRGFRIGSPEDSYEETHD